MKDSMKYIDFTLDTIEEQTVGMSFEASLGDVTPQMKNVVGGVQAVLFGKPLEVSQVTPHNIEFEEVSPVNESWESQLGL